jgi:hypothetical protein
VFFFCEGIGKKDRITEKRLIPYETSRHEKHTGVIACGQIPTIVKESLTDGRVHLPQALPPPPAGRLRKKPRHYYIYMNLPIVC